VAAILNVVPSTLERTLLDGVTSRDPALSEQIRNLMFVFEDIGSLDSRALQRLLRDVDVKQLALALKAASTELKAKLMSAMSQRAAQALNDEIDLLGPARLRDVEAAQGAIVATVRQLEEAGEIVTGSGDDDVVL
jgi:flagellar motor switch protein FliG